MNIEESLKLSIDTIDQKVKEAKSMEWHFMKVELQCITLSENGRTGVWTAIEIARGNNSDKLFEIAEFVKSQITESIEIDRSEPKDGFDQELVLAIVAVWTLKAIMKGIGTDLKKFQQLVEYEQNIS